MDRNRNSPPRIGRVRENVMTTCNPLNHEAGLGQSADDLSAINDR